MSYPGTAQPVLPFLSPIRVHGREQNLLRNSYPFFLGWYSSPQASQTSVTDRFRNDSCPRTSFAFVFVFLGIDPFRYIMMKIRI